MLLRVEVRFQGSLWTPIDTERINLFISTIVLSMESENLQTEMKHLFQQQETNATYLNTLYELLTFTLHIV